MQAANTHTPQAKSHTLARAGEARKGPTPLGVRCPTMKKMGAPLARALALMTQEVKMNLRVRIPTTRALAVSVEDPAAKVRSQ